MNPWLSINLEDYEKHMSHKKVYQLQTLSRVTGSTVKLFQPQKILVLGAAAGNGFEHFDKSMDVYAVDINKQFLDKCAKRYGKSVKNLIPINIDIDTVPLPIDNNSIDLVICHLFLEYVSMENAAGEIYRLLNSSGIANIVIQKNNGNKFVSESGAKELELLSQIARAVNSDEVERILGSHKFTKLCEIEEPLPNGKSFLIYNYRKMSP